MATVGNNSLAAISLSTFTPSKKSLHYRLFSAERQCLAYLLNFFQDIHFFILLSRNFRHLSIHSAPSHSLQSPPLPHAIHIVIHNNTNV